MHILFLDSIHFRFLDYSPLDICTYTLLLQWSGTATLMCMVSTEYTDIIWVKLCKQHSICWMEIHVWSRSHAHISRISVIELCSSNPNLHLSCQLSVWRYTSSPHACLSKNSGVLRPFCVSTFLHVKLEISSFTFKFNKPLFNSSIKNCPSATIFCEAPVTATATSQTVIRVSCVPYLNTSSYKYIFFSSLLLASSMVFSRLFEMTPFFIRVFAMALASMSALNLS